MRHTAKKDAGSIRRFRWAQRALMPTRPFWPYLAAAATSLAALEISLLVGGGATDVPQLLFLGAVAVTAWYGGLWPGLLATLLGFIALDYFFELPAYSLEISEPRTLLESAAYVVVAVLLGSLNAQLRAARARAEASLSEARAAVRARDYALAAVSHDMRTPLTAIQATVAALQQAHGRMSDTDLQLLANIAAESRRLEHFITDALALTRIEAGVRPYRTLNAPGEVVSAILDRYMPVLNGREITFDVPDTLPLVFFDVSLLQQTLGNLLDNVAAHTPPGTHVSITGRIDELAQLRLEVADSGLGVAPADRERIFRKFERLHVQRAGAGLGLTLARAATEAQGGELWVESSALGGARFIVCLPAVDGSTAADGA